MPPPFTIATDGDEVEKNWWGQWTRDQFSSYEVFWVARVVLHAATAPGAGW